MSIPEDINETGFTVEGSYMKLCDVPEVQQTTPASRRRKLLMKLALYGLLFLAGIGLGSMVIASVQGQYFMHTF